MVKDFTVISLFCGGGGSSTGYHMAGFKELLAVDFNKNSIETMRANYYFPILEADITKLTSAEIMKFANIKKGELDILDGSPPCQGFSLCGSRNVGNSKNELYLEYIRILNDLQPKIFVMENVKGMVIGKFKSIFNKMIADLKNTNYVVKCKLMNAMYYGIPQNRARLIFIGVRKDLNLDPVFPTPSNKTISVKQAFAGLVNDNSEIEEAYNTVKKSIKDILPLMGAGESASKYTNGVKFFNVCKNHFVRPSYTITKYIDICHYSKNRAHTRKELKILSSFPENYKFIGNLHAVYARIGNSVPPLLICRIAKKLKEDILGKAITI